MNFVKTFGLSFLLLALCVVLEARAQAPGPYYFVPDGRASSGQSFWGKTDNFGGPDIVENYHLLATLLGDRPPMLKTIQLVPRSTFDYRSGTVLIQPFASLATTSSGNSIITPLPLGPKLKAFLDDPLDGGKFDLMLPFTDSRVALSDRSALLRNSAGEKAWHVAIDFDYSGGTKNGFDVVAAADGVVVGRSGSGRSVTIEHKAVVTSIGKTRGTKTTLRSGKSFITAYGHLAPGSTSHLNEGKSIKQGDNIGRVKEPDSYTHLHFAVAVQGPEGKINGTKVPKLWYTIDPFGVYDYRRNKNSSTEYNYLRNNRLNVEVRGIRHAYVFRTNPPIGSLP